MVSITTLVIPIVVSAVLVFIIAAMLWMVAPHHKHDFQGFANEEAIRAAVGKPAAGLYTIPHAASDAARKDPAWLKKLADGPVAFVTVAPSRDMNMGPMMIQSILLYLVVSAITAYVAGHVLAAGTPYLQVFRVVGTVSWLAYGFGTASDSIWFARPWSSTFKNLFDALLMGLVTAGVFGWLWPR